ncbi:MAG: hypothetical protein Q8K47_00965, partial [Nitrosomonas sp.]|nr:hypothetical protein [Nitrosomonas sp.]
QTEMVNGEAEVVLYSVIVHETETGYAQCFRDDIDNPNMGEIDLEKIFFSEAITSVWSDPQLFEKIKRGVRVQNPSAI